MCLSTHKKEKDRTKWGLPPSTVRFFGAFFQCSEGSHVLFGKKKEKDRTKWDPPPLVVGIAHADGHR